MADYIPNSDADFDLWLDNFAGTLNQEKAALKLADPDLAGLTAAKSAWAAALADWAAKRAAADAARQAKDDARAAVEVQARARARLLQADASVPDATRAALGLNVRDQTRTAAPAPATRPAARVDTSQRLRHTIAFTDEQTPDSRRKPDGAQGCEVWVKIGGPPPADPSELQFLALDTSSPYVASYDGADGGKTAHYMLRWVSTRGDKGPWSQTASATIAA